MSSVSKLSDENLQLFLDNLTKVVLDGAAGTDERSEKGGMSDFDGGMVAAGMILPFLLENRLRGRKHDLDFLLDRNLTQK
jgi:hypothetical protein